jgi:hypothetical protein
MAGTFVPSQKGTQLLQDSDNFRYRINKYNSDGSRAWYYCVKRKLLKCPATAVFIPEEGVIEKILSEHNHGSSVLEKFARDKEKELIDAAALVGTVSTGKVLTEIKMNLERSAMPEAKAMMRKSRCLGQALYREKRKKLGYTGAVPKSPALIMETLPEKFKKTADGSPFLRYMGYVEDDESKLLMLFISEHGKRTLEKSSELYCDGTFHTTPTPFYQVRTVAIIRLTT